MRPISVGVLSKIPNLLKELQLRVRPEVTLVNVAQVTGSKVDPKCAKHLNDFDVIVADYDCIGPHLYTLENVKFIQGTWAGLDALMPHIKPDVKLNVPILRFSGDHFGKIISEYVVACIVNHERDAFKMQANQLRRCWSQEGRIHESRTIYDLTIGVMGVGKIGSRLMNTLKFMGANVRALGRRSTIDKADFSYVDEYFPTTELSAFVAECDYIVNTLPNTNETKGMLNTPLLETCKRKNSIFINVGRGGIVSDESLLEALENDWLSHAYLDVFNEEPLPENHPFWTSEKVKITPHVAAVSRPQDIAEQFVENLNLFVNNAKLTAQVDFTRGY